jgi:DhnA family fructose-bisphosphate aldolase class Ia
LPPRGSVPTAATSRRLPRRRGEAAEAGRPTPLVPLYASFATLQALDYHSTRRALADGSAYEANPLRRSIVKNPPAFIAVKAAPTAGVIVVGEKMWKKNRVGAVLFVAGTTAAMGVIVGRNYAVR